MKTIGSEPANAVSFCDPSGSLMPELHLGLTKREYFASMMLSALLSKPMVMLTTGDESASALRRQIVRDAISNADMLIEELNK